MKIAIMGAGAVGSYYGGMLARAGHAVTLIARPPHVQAIRAHGLRLQTTQFDESVPLLANTHPSALSDADCVLLCVKTSDTAAAGAAMAPHLPADAVVLSLQNGIDNPERLQPLIPNPVIPTLVYVAAEMAGPGHVRHHGRGELLIPDTPATHSLRPVFEAAGIPVQLTDNIAQALWTKLTINCIYNPLSAISQSTYGPMIQSIGVPQAMRDVFEECRAVAQAQGTPLPDTAWDAVLSIARTMPTQRSSTAQDLAHGKPTEIDHLNGYVVRQGEQLAIPTPVNRVLHSLVKLLESTHPR